MRREHRPEAWVGRNRGVPDPVDRLDRVPDPDRVQTPPGAGREHAGVDLQMKVPVRIPGPGGVVPDHGGLDPLDRHLHLPSPRPHPGGRVGGDPADDLRGGLVLRFVQGGRDLRMQGRCQGPGLRSVDGDLDEPQRVRVVTDPTLRPAGVDVDAGDPLLVDLPGHRTRVLDTVAGRDQPLGDPGALTEVVVIRARPIPLDIGPGSTSCAAVELHTAMHADHPESRSQTSVDNQQMP